MSLTWEHSGGQWIGRRGDFVAAIVWRDSAGWHWSAVGPEQPAAGLVDALERAERGADMSANVA